MPFEVSYEVKHPWGSPFQVHLQAFLGGFSCDLAHASKERNFTVDVASGILKARKAESFSLQVCKFLIRNLIRDHFLKFSTSLKVPSRNLVRGSLLVALENVYCKPATLVKRRLLEISRRATFRNIPCTC